MAGVKFDTRTLEAVAAAQRAFPGVLRSKMTAAASRVILPAFEQEMRRSQAPGQVKRLVVPGSYASAGFGGFETTAGVSRERLRGGAVASALARPWEFGTTKQGQFTTVHRKNLRKGSTYQRRTMAQMPTRRRKGWVFYPAMARLDKRAVPLYVQLAVLVMADALEGKS